MVQSPEYYPRHFRCLLIQMLATTILKIQLNDTISIMLKKIKYLSTYRSLTPLRKVVFQIKLLTSYWQVRVWEKVWRCVTLLVPISPLDSTYYTLLSKWQKKGLLSASMQIYLMSRLINLRRCLNNFLIPRLTNSRRSLEANSL